MRLFFTKRRIGFILLSFMVGFYIFSYGGLLEVSATENHINISISGKEVIFTESSGYPFIDNNNRTMVPLRVTMEAAGATVDWDIATQTVLLQTANAGILVPINAGYIIANSEQIKIDAAAKIVNARTYLPIRAVLEASGFSVEWDEATKTIIAVESNDKTDNMQNAIDVRDMLNKYWVYENGRWQREGDRLVEQAAINDVLNKANAEIDWDKVTIVHNTNSGVGSEESSDLDGIVDFKKTESGNKAETEFRNKWIGVGELRDKSIIVMRLDNLVFYDKAYNKLLEIENVPNDLGENIVHTSNGIRYQYQNEYGYGQIYFNIDDLKKAHILN